MPRQERTKSGTGIYHVMLRGINKQVIFEDAEDYLQMTDYGAGIRQLSRLTGVSYGVIQNSEQCRIEQCRNDHRTAFYGKFQTNYAI